MPGHALVTGQRVGASDSESIRTTLLRTGKGVIFPAVTYQAGVSVAAAAGPAVSTTLSNEWC
jgi:hypothetical protein